MRRLPNLILLRSRIQILSALCPAKAAALAVQLFTRPTRHARPERERQAIQSARSFQFKNGLSAYRWGSGARKVLLVHGWDGRGTQLAAFAPALAAAGFEVTALDGPAHGDSPGDSTDPIHLAEAIRAVGDEMGPLVSVIGHSMGAGSTVIAAARGLRVEKLILIAGASSYGEVARRFMSLIKLGARARKIFIGLMKMRTGLGDDELNIARLGSSLALPVLIFHDRHDPEIDLAESEAITRAVRNAALVVTEGLGHRKILRDSGVIQRAVDFIS